MEESFAWNGVVFSVAQISALFITSFFLLIQVVTRLQTEKDVTPPFLDLIAPFSGM